MDVDEMYAWWNGAAQTNSMNAILSNVDEWDPDVFFSTGRDWLYEQRQFAATARVDLAGDTALDFGCGIGRMTRALSEHYHSVVGIDISDEMVEQARRANTSSAIEFQQVVGLPLPFGDDTFDLVYSTIVVQHIPLPYNVGYVDEFFRVSRDLVLFDAPSHTRRPSDPPPGHGIFLLDCEIVFNRAARHGFELMAIRDFPATETKQFQYLFRRAG